MSVTASVPDNRFACLPSGGGSHDTQAFDAIVRRCRPELLNYLRSRVHAEADAEDIAQDACARLLHYRHDPTIDDLRLMLFRIANNLVTDFYRHHHCQQADAHVPLENAGPLYAHDRPQPEHVADQQALARLKRTIARLPPKCQLVFMLSRFDALSHRQIADKLGISMKMVEKHITRALVACQSAVGDRDA